MVNILTFLDYNGNLALKPKLRKKIRDYGALSQNSDEGKLPVKKIFYFTKKFGAVNYW